MEYVSPDRETSEAGLHAILRKRNVINLHDREYEKCLCAAFGLARILEIRIYEAVNLLCSDLEWPSSHHCGRGGGIAMN